VLFLKEVFTLKIKAAICAAAFAFLFSGCGNDGADTTEAQTMASADSVVYQNLSCHGGAHHNYYNGYCPNGYYQNGYYYNGYYPSGYYQNNYYGHHNGHC